LKQKHEEEIKSQSEKFSSYCEEIRLIYQNEKQMLLDKIAEEKQNLEANEKEKI